MQSEVLNFVTHSQSWLACLPVLIILTPIIGAFLALFLGKDNQNRSYVIIGSAVATFILTCMMYTPVINGIFFDEKLLKGIFHSINYLPGAANIPFFNITFKVDPAGLLVALVTALIYMVAIIYGSSYMSVEGKDIKRYEICSLLTLAVNMGVILAGDFFTLFLFFEGLVIFPYFMFSHRENEKSLRGANIYLYLGVASGLALLGAIFILYAYTGSVDIKPMAEIINKNVPSNIKCLLSFLFIIGFGGKAGIFLEHFWMPKGYPESPAPTPAMSSGAMIKAGAYGIFRVVNMIFTPENTALAKEWLTASNIGYIVIWIGVVTMFLGVLGALLSSNSNRMLAYHSVSQMGYIVMGIGCAAYLGTEGAMGLSGALYHIVNHSLFKVCLFLGVGAVYFRTKEDNMYNLGGLLKNMPVAGIGLLIAVCGISGLPFFNGFASKTLLHHAINEAYEHSVHAGSPDQWLKFAEIIFIITAAGTFASNMKLFVLTFLGKRRDEHKNVQPAPKPMQAAIVILASIILIIGVWPNLILSTFIGPALSYFGFNPASHAYQLIYDVNASSSQIAILWPMQQSFAEVVHNLSGGADAVLLGGVMFLLGFKFHMFHIEVPYRFTVEYLYEKAFNAFKYLCIEPLYMFMELADKIVSYFMLHIWLSCSDERSLYKKIDEKAIEIIGGEPIVDKFLANAYLEKCDTASDIDAGVVDDSIVGTGRFTISTSKVLRKLQSGYVQNYMLIMGIGLLAIISIFLIIN